MSAEKEELSVILEASNELAENNSTDGQLDAAVVKEEEVITKRKTELTTTKQIETRVKRQVKFEDGKVIEDSGPIVSTATTEDTDKVESEQVERKSVPKGSDVVDGPKAVEFNQHEVSSPKHNLLPMKTNDNNLRTIEAERDDGLIREVKENRVVSREDTIELTEVEDVRHLGDFSDAAYVKAVNSGSENIEKILLSPDAKLQLVPVGPRLIKNIVNKHKTVDSEDTDLKFIRQPDGTLVTEQKKTTEHEEILDEDLPKGDNQSTGSQEKILKHKESSQRFVKQRAEQEVEYVSDGKVITKEMRYAAENDYMERSGSKEEETDWDSLSDRVKKTRRLAQKTFMQKQRENGERKDALTNRPLDFDREEETRRKETYKWLDNHFGSDSTSKDSRDESTISDIVVEPTKKSYFNVTIKANGNGLSTNGHHNVTTSSSSSITNNNNLTQKSSTLTRQSNINAHTSNNENKSFNKLTSTAKVYVPERESTPKKFFQGISDWSERKEPKAFVATPLGTKAFRDELMSTLERKQRAMNLQSVSTKTLEDSKYRSKSQDLLRSQKEDLGYLSGSRTDLRAASTTKKYTNDDYAVPMKKKTTTNGFLHREDSGFRESKEDLRSPPHREDSFGREDAKQASIQRDDSAYVSSSTYFTSPRSPRRPRSPVLIKTPDSGVRSPTPTNDIESDEINQPPTVPQRKKNVENKIRTNTQQTKNEDYANYPAKPRRDPPIDYLPSASTRSRSVSPLPPIHHVYHDRKSFQKTRFSSPPSTPTPTIVRSSQTQTSASAAAKKKSLGSSISNSLRKFVGKIRSVSAERKVKSKTPVKRSPSPLAPITRHKSVSNLPSSSYQRTDYVIDGHIGNGMKFRAPSTSTQASTNFRRERTFDHIERGSSTTDNEMPITSERVTHHTQKKTLITSPKQRYYLGENPYQGTLFGKENKIQNGESDFVKQKNYYNSSSSRSRQRSEEPRMNSNTTSTLGRFSKSTNRLTSHESSSHNRNGNGYISAALQESNDNYRSSQTLPRKLDHKTHKPISQSTINVSIVNNVKHPIQNTGPAKPARTYKSIQRSKSFNVHGMNGTNDPSPIYMEKLTKNNYRNQNGHHNYNREATESPHRVITTTTHHTKIYKSTPQLIDPLGDIKLKSPSIVNLISRSTKDLTSLNDHHYIDRRYNASSPFRATPELRKNGYMRNYDDDEMNTKNIKFIERESLGSKGSSRSSPIVGKDSPIGILRRGSNSTDNENYSETFKYSTKSNDPSNPSVTDTVETFSKKVIPEEIDPRTKKETTIERHEIKKVTTSRGFAGSPSPPNLKYYDVNHNRNGNVVIELKNNY